MKAILAVAVLRNVPTKRGSVGLISSCECRKNRASQTGPSSIKAAVERAIERTQAGRLSQDSQSKWQSQVCLRDDATAVTGPVMKA